MSTKHAQFLFKNKIGRKVFSQLKNKITKQKQIEKVYNLRKGFAMTVSTAGKKFERKYFNANLAAAFYFYEFSVFKIKT